MANQARVLPFGGRRQVLPTLDLRTMEERRELTSSQRNIQAITGILQLMGQAEKVRKDRQSLDRVATAIAGGASTIEAITAVAQQQPQFGTGLQGLLQKIGGAFQPQGGGGTRQNILQMIIGEKLKQALAPPAKPTIAEQRAAEARKTKAVPGTPEFERIAEGPAKPTKIQELLNEGYSRQEARMIRDISHGLKPRASARKQYENMGDVEKRDFLSKLRQRAEGQYYNIEGGNIEPRQPKLLAWVEQEEAKLPIVSQDNEPQDKDEFLKTVKSIEDDVEAKAYYDKWVSKWQ